MSQPLQTPQGALGLRLTLLGSPGLTDDKGAPVPGLGPGKPLGMLAYLAFQGTARRDELIALLWGDVIESKARNAFRQTLHRLRASLGPILSSEQDMIVLQERAIWCDALEFQQAVADGDIERALGLYGGAFLDGLDLGEEAFAEWAGEQRLRLASAYEGALARAAEDALRSGDWRLAAERARKLAAASPHNGDAAVLEATALLAGGRRAEAVSALTVYARRMEADLGAKPSEAAASLLQTILSSPAAPEKARAANLGDSLFRKPEFVGRERELARLLALWRNAAAGDARSCIVHGELGIGKSRLAAEFLLRTPSIASPLVLQGQERETAVAMPYASIAEALRPALNAPGLAGASQHLLAEAARLLPELRDQFDLPEPVALADDTERIRFYEGIAALIDAVSYEQPVCMVLEDLHYGSGSTLELVRYLSRRLRASSVMIVATWETRDGVAPAARGMVSVGAGSDVETAAAKRLLDEFEAMPLEGLSPAESERMLVGLLQRAGIAQPEIARLVGLSSGSPLRLTELAEQASRGEVPPALPISVRDALWRRLQECSPHEQRLFVAASLFSQAVSIRLLAAASHVSESAALEGVLSLERRGLLLQREGRLAPASPAAAELAIETTGAAGVSLLAGWAADALAAEPGPAHGELARLYALADRRPAAYRHARAAALAAAACGARQETGQFLSLAASAASTEKERSEIDGLSLALGQTGQRLLPATTPARGTEALDDNPGTTGEADAPAATPPRQHPIGRIRHAARASRWVLVSAAMGVAAILAVQSAVTDRTATRGNVLVDTLVLVERLGSREQRFYIATGLLTNEVRPARGLRVPANAPAWVDSLSLPWINPRTSPNGRMVAVERVTPFGVDLYVINAASRETTPIAVNSGDHIIEGWSPDGSQLLVVVGRTSDGGAYDSDLYVYAVAAASAPLPIDTSVERSVVSARWSPRGTHVAWVARDGQTRQQEVFVALPDGSRARNLSMHPAEDFDLAWAADGQHVAFTSERDGNADIYSVEVSTGALRRMTFHPAQDSRPSFSPDGQFLAFESARQGRIETYVMPSYAGVPRRVLSNERSLEILEWRGAPPPFIEAVSIRTNVSITPGDSAIAVAEAIDQYGNASDPGLVRWSSLDPAIVQIRAISGSPDRVLLIAERQGSARITVDAPGWRSDTVLVHASPTGIAAVREDFESPSLSRFWTSLGSPAPHLGPDAGRGRSGGLVLNGDAQWETGILGAQFLTLRPGLSVQLWLSAPFTTYGPLGREVSIALVAPDARTSLDSISPQFLKLVSFSWMGDAARFRYAVEREFRTEPAVLLGNANQHRIRITIEPSGQAAFYVDGTLRWRSSVLATTSDGLRRVQLWIGSRATGSLAAVDDVEISP